MRSTPKRVADAVTGKRCPICLNRIEIRSAAAIFPCLHAYCIGCIRKWSDFKHNCPLCNVNFSSWFCEIEYKSFEVENLPPSGSSRRIVSVSRDEALRRRRAQFFEQRRLIARYRGASRTRSQASVLPRQRSFVREVHEDPEIIANRVRNWRASIYEHRMWVVPLPRKNGLLQQIDGNRGAKEMLLGRIKPWIQRELQALLGDPDPTVIVHVVSSLFISHLNKNENIQGQIRSEDDFLSPLRPFLHEHTELFWHELRCFAENSFAMEAYDTITVYRRNGLGR